MDLLLLLFISFFLLILLLGILVWFWIVNDQKIDDSLLGTIESNLIDRYYHIRNLIFYEKIHELKKYCDKKILDIINKSNNKHIMFSTSYYNIVKVENQYFLKIMGRSLYENIIDNWIFEEKEGNFLLVEIS